MKYLEKICCFFIFSRIFLHMCPNEKYEKYISALTGWVAFCIFLSPFLSGNVLEQRYETIEKEWKNYFDISVEDTIKNFEEESVRAAEEIVQEQGVVEEERGIK